MSESTLVLISKSIKETKDWTMILSSRKWTVSYEILHFGGILFLNLIHLSSTKKKDPEGLSSLHCYNFMVNLQFHPLFRRKALQN